MGAEPDPMLAQYGFVEEVPDSKLKAVSLSYGTYVERQILQMQLLSLLLV